MKKIVTLLTVLSLLVIFNSGTCMAAFWKKSHVNVITKGQLLKKIAAGNVQVVNVLSPDFYNLGSISGSKKIPLHELDQRAGELDKSKEVVTYCANYKCNASREAAIKLKKMGFNVSAYEGGIKEWKDSHLPTET